VNGSCVAVSSNLTDGAMQGRCDSDDLSPGVVWAHGFCPTDYSWMGLLGLVMYLMFFAPGKTYRKNILISLECCRIGT
jgi:SP family myo-inositol transporter-like MFS transporter 13